MVQFSYVPMKRIECAMENKNAIEVLNDLIKINNDRIEGYEKAAENVGKADVMLKTLFYQISEESQEYKKELTDRVRALGGEPATSSTVPGKIYRTWMDVKVTFSGDDAKATLESCEFGEDAALKAYRQALDHNEEYPASVRHLIEDQMSMIKMSHDLIRNRRDEYKEVHH
jgi:uncharacterized protein (TIGR02284 family)